MPNANSAQLASVSAYVGRYQAQLNRPSAAAPLTNSINRVVSTNLNARAAAAQTAQRGLQRDALVAGRTSARAMNPAAPAAPAPGAPAPSAPYVQAANSGPAPVTEGRTTPPVPGGYDRARVLVSGQVS